MQIKTCKPATKVQGCSGMPLHNVMFAQPDYTIHITFQRNNIPAANVPNHKRDWICSSVEGCTEGQSDDMDIGR